MEYVTVECMSNQHQLEGRAQQLRLRRSGLCQRADATASGTKAPSTRLGGLPMILGESWDVSTTRDNIGGSSHIRQGYQLLTLLTPHKLTGPNQLTCLAFNLTNSQRIRETNNSIFPFKHILRLVIRSIKAGGARVRLALPKEPPWMTESLAYWPD